ncbi:hypothetical protein [Plebeiibacterium marinum]|uniref:Uncharacterized protein n=1 Tax=Plebeiibacterium marinum TaxID=2992111 RepID=A0AAE3SJY8_9BACT|nr:hypothetical protein [Plebeiobacterium marinum]MCW3806004.1 hypothetical protein [Plebeiobacterium marinum]
METTEILLKIREIQKNADKKFFNQGIFPSYRQNILTRRKIADDNIFFSASILYILDSYTHLYNEKELKIYSDIKKEVTQNFDFYTNKPNRNSFNFWRKENGKHFPNGPVFSKLAKFKLPDDIDTTSLIQLCKKPPYKYALKTKQAIPNHANTVKLKIKNGHKSLQHLKAYSTWFGNNMPIEFDVCVLSNLFLWINEYNFDLNQHDLDSLKLLETTICESLYFKSPFHSSPEYPNASIILYHLARLIAKTNYLNKYRSKLVGDIIKLKNQTKDAFQLLILNSSLSKLGIYTNNANTNELMPNLSNHWWFTAGLLSIYGNSIIQKIAPWSIFHFRFVCPALNLSLLLENKLIAVPNLKTK